jgi:carbon-monoxide dehydrogenase large subunit
MDLAADELGIDPVEPRRRNLLGPDVFPYTTLMGTTYDSGDYALPLERAVERAGYERLLAEQAERRPARPLAASASASAPTSRSPRAARRPSTARWPSARTASSPSRPGPRPTARVTRPRSPCSWPTACTSRSRSIRYLQSDTDVVPRGGGTGGSRSLQIGGTAVYTAAGAVVERARRIAARLLEADVDDIVVGEDGRVGVAGVPARALSWAELAQAAARDDDGDGPLAAALDTAQDGATFPSAPTWPWWRSTSRPAPSTTCATSRWTTVVASSTLLVRGQQHGGIAQGVAQALWEQFVYDEDGNPITSTLAEYAMPSAAEPLLRDREHGDADTAQPARGEGHR